jgi:hypothetical protein
VAGNEDAPKVLVVAARQPALVELLQEAGFAVDARTRPVQPREAVEADVAVVFRGRLIGRSQASSLAEQGVHVIEILTVDPPSPSTSSWLRLSNRITKSDLVQIVRAVAHWTREGAALAATQAA